MASRSPAASSSLERGRRIRRFITIHLGLLGGAALWLLIVRGCPIRWLFGAPCPGCGMTRALTSALRLDFAGAFSYHPLFWTVPPAVLYLAHQSAWRLPGGKRAQTALLAVLAAAFLGVYIYRLFFLPPSSAIMELDADFTQAALYRFWKFLT